MTNTAIIASFCIFPSLKKSEVVFATRDPRAWRALLRRSARRRWSVAHTRHDVGRKTGGTKPLRWSSCYDARSRAFLLRHTQRTSRCCNPWCWAFYALPGSLHFAPGTVGYREQRRTPCPTNRAKAYPSCASFRHLAGLCSKTIFKHLF